MNAEDKDGGVAPGVQRLDKWLWFARVVKSRSLAQKLVTGGRVRVNREKTTTPAKSVRIGDVLTVAVAERVLVMKVLLPGTRRGPAPEAARLYELLSPTPTVAELSPAGEGDPEGRRTEEPVVAGPKPARRQRGSGRPTKRERRETDRLRGDWS